MAIAVIDQLASVLGHGEQVLTVLQVAAYVLADHHAQLVDAQLRAGSVVAPEVVVGTAGCVGVVRVLFPNLVDSELVL